MYSDKNNAGKYPENLHKSFILMASLIVLLVGAVGGAIAYLISDTKNVVNDFEYVNVTCQVEESFENGVKSGVTVKNTGETSAYIRAAVIVTWKDKNGNVYGKVPVEETDYSISYGDGWTSDGDYFYCDSVIAPGASTPVLIEECTEVSENRPNGDYALSVEIIADAVQSKPAAVISEVWGYTPTPAVN